jgi:hypothetical protein
MLSKKALLLVAASLLAGAASGCYSTWDIAPRDLRALDGFREGQTRVIAGAGDDEIEFTSRTELSLRGTDGLETGGTFRSINVRGPIFYGIKREQGEYISADLSRMANVQVRNFSTGKTVGLSVGLGLGVPALVALGAAIYAASTVSF